MLANSKRLCIVVLLLAGIFFAAQLHCCFDLNSGPTVSHICPVCHTLGAAIATSAVAMAVAGPTHRLEMAHSLPPLPSLGFRSIPSRAPPVAR